MDEDFGHREPLRGLLLCAVAVVISLTAHAQSIVRFAGGASNDGRPAVNTTLVGPKGLAFDRHGNLHFAETGNRVRRIDALTGLLSTFAGNGEEGSLGDGAPATAAQLRSPTDIVFDGQDKAYVAAGSLRRIDLKTGLIQSIAIDTYALGGLAVNSLGNIYATAIYRVIRVDAKSHVVTIVAGNGTRGYSGDGGPATAAQLTDATDVAVDSSGNIFIADKDNFRIRRVDAASGIITTVAGNGSQEDSGDGGSAIQAGFRAPGSIAIHLEGNLYVLDIGSHRIRRIDLRSGIITTVAGNGRLGLSGDGGPATQASLNFNGGGGLTFDASGSMYISDYGNRRLRRVDAINGIITTVAGGPIERGDGGPATAALVKARTLALDQQGDLYISDVSNLVVHKVSKRDGTIRAVAGNGIFGIAAADGLLATQASLVYPQDVAVDRAGNIYIPEVGGRLRRVDARSGLIATVAGSGAGGPSGDGGPATLAGIGQIYDIQFDSKGNIYLATPLQMRIRRIDASSGIITTVAGTGAEEFSGDGGPATLAGIGDVAAIAIDSGGNLYLSDNDNSRIRKVDVGSGLITTFAQVRPLAMTIDAADNLYFFDTAELRVRRLSLVSGQISTVAGSGASGYDGDGGPATAAAVYPKDLTVDNDGNLYLADSQIVRLIPACETVTAPALALPSDGAVVGRGSATLRWMEVPGAFSYDVFLDRVNPPGVPIASDLKTTGFLATNLESDSVYYWKVVADGDPFCPGRTGDLRSDASTGQSEVRTFTTTSSCGVPPEVRDGDL